MGFSTVVRLTLGFVFVCVGSLKITRFGHAIVPDTHKQMAKDFGKYLRVSPFKPYLKITSVQYMHIVGYTELLAGMGALNIVSHSFHDLLQSLDPSVSLVKDNVPDYIKWGV